MFERYPCQRQFAQNILDVLMVFGDIGILELAMRSGLKLSSKMEKIHHSDLYVLFGPENLFKPTLSQKVSNILPSRPGPNLNHQSPELLASHHFY